MTHTFARKPSAEAVLLDPLVIHEVEMITAFVCVQQGSLCCAGCVVCVCVVLEANAFFVAILSLNLTSAATSQLRRTCSADLCALFGSACTCVRVCGSVAVKSFSTICLKSTTWIELFIFLCGGVWVYECTPHHCRCNRGADVVCSLQLIFTEVYCILPSTATSHSICAGVCAYRKPCPCLSCWTLLERPWPSGNDRKWRIICVTLYRVTSWGFQWLYISHILRGVWIQRLCVQFLCSTVSKDKPLTTHNLLTVSQHSKSGHQECFITMTVIGHCRNRWKFLL